MLRHRNLLIGFGCGLNSIGWKQNLLCTFTATVEIHFILALMVSVYVFSENLNCAYLGNKRLNCNVYT